MSDATTAIRHEAVLDREAFLRFCDAVRTCASWVSLEITTDGYHVAAVDAANVQAVWATLPADACQHFDAADVTVGVDLTTLAERIREMPDGDTVTLVVDTGDETIEAASDTVAVTHDLLDTDDVRTSPTAPDYDSARVSVDGDRLADAVGFVAGGADHVHVEHEPRSVDLWLLDHNADDEASQARVPLAEIHDRGDDDRIDSAYPLDYLTDIVPLARGWEVGFESGAEVPLRLTVYATVEIEFLLAPRLFVDDVGGESA